MHDVRVRLGVPRRKHAPRLASWTARVASLTPRVGRQDRVRAALPVVGFAASYLVAAQASALLMQRASAPGGPVSTSLAVPGALLVCVLLLAPPRRWWPYLLAAFPVHLGVALQIHQPLPLVLAGYLANVTLGVCTAALMRRWLAVPVRFARVREVGIFVACAGAGVLPSAGLDAAARRTLLARAYWPAWQAWYLAELLAILVLVPAVVPLAAVNLRRIRGIPRGRAVEGALLALALVVVGGLMFGGGIFGSHDADALIYLPVPVLLWAAVRFGVGGSAGALAMIALVAIVGTADDMGPFVQGPFSQDLLQLQLFLTVIGVPLLFLGAVVQERRQALDGLAHSEGRSRAFFELNGVGAAEIALDTGRFLRVNDALCRITGYPRPELLRLPFDDITHPDDREENLRVFHAFRRQTEGTAPSLSFEKRYVRRDGATIWVQIDATLVRDRAGQPVHVVTVVQDVTERRRAEEALRKSEEALRQLLETTNAVPWRTEATLGRRLYVGPQAAHLLGYPAERWYEEGFWAANLHPQDRERAVDFCLAEQRRRRDFDFEYRMLSATGEVVWIHDIVHVEPDDGHPRTLSGFLIDITERKRLEREREAAYAAAQTANEEMRRLQAITDTVLSTLALDDLLRELLERVHAAVGGDSVGILLLDAAGRQLTFRAVRGPEGPVPVEATIPVGQGFSGRIAATRAPLIMDDLSTIDLLYPRMWASRRSAMGVPLLVEGRLLGVVYASSDVAGCFAERDVQLLQRAADRMALAIDRARLFEEERAARAEAERQAEQLDRTFEGMTDGLVVYDAQGRMTRINAAAQRILGLDAAPPDYAYLTVLERAALYAARGEQGRPLAPDERPVERVLAGQAPDGASALAVQMRTLDGREVELNASAAPLRDREGRMVGAVCILHDQTEQRQMERALRASEARFRAAFASAGIGMALADLDGRITEANRPLVEMLGYCEEELRELTFDQLTHPDDVGAHLPLYRRALAGEISGYQMEKRYVHKGGRVIWARVSVGIVRDGADQPLYLVGQLEDVTARKQAEEALRESEARFRTAFESASVGMSLVAPTGRLLEVNRPLCEMLGYSPEELLDRTFADLTLPADLGANVEVFRRALAGETDRYQMEKRYVHKRGHIVWGHMSAGVVRDGAGRSLYLVGQLEDITERKRTEEALRESEARYRTVVEAQTELITRYLPDTTLTFVNDANCRFVGRSREELLGTRFIDDLPPSARARVRETVQALLEHPGVITIEHEYVLGDGSRRWQEWVNRTIPDADGRVVELQGIGRDITERKRAEEALEQLTVRLLDVQDEERRRLARELHDGAAQTIAALGLNLTNLHTATRGGIRDRAHFERILADSRQLLEQALRETRTLAYVLHPPQLDEGGLVPALEWYVKGFSQRSGIRVALEASAELGRLPDEVERALYRIVAECLANVQRHSGSPSARIALARRRSTVRLLVADRGGGMGGSAPAGAREEAGDVLMLGVGIPGMRQRVRQLNGWLKIRSGVRGTIVVAVVPVPGATMADAPPMSADHGVGRRA